VVAQYAVLNRALTYVQHPILSISCLKDVGNDVRAAPKALVLACTCGRTADSDHQSLIAENVEKHRRRAEAMDSTPSRSPEAPGMSGHAHVLECEDSSSCRLEGSRQQAASMSIAGTRPGPRYAHAAHLDREPALSALAQT
jgi:hypothetical protein